MSQHINSKGSLAAYYGVTVKTLNVWIVKAELPMFRWRKVLSPAEVLQLTERLGKPIKEIE